LASGWKADIGGVAISDDPTVAKGWTAEVATSSISSEVSAASSSVKAVGKPLLRQRNTSRATS